MIRILIVDDHPAMRAGLVAILRCEPGLVSVVTADPPAVVTYSGFADPLPVEAVRKMRGTSRRYSEWTSKPYGGASS